MRRAAIERRDGRADRRRVRADLSRIGSPRTRASVLLRERPTSTGRPDPADPLEAADQLEVLVRRLAEADPRVEADVVLGNPCRDRDREPLLEKAGDLLHNVVVTRRDLHRARLPLHVHQANVRARVGDRTRELGIAAQGGDVVDEHRARCEGLSRDLGLRGVDRDRHAGELLEHRQHAS